MSRHAEPAPARTGRASTTKSRTISSPSWRLVARHGCSPGKQGNEGAALHTQERERNVATSCCWRRLAALDRGLPLSLIEAVAPGVEPGGAAQCALHVPCRQDWLGRRLQPGQVLQEVIDRPELPGAALCKTASRRPSASSCEHRDANSRRASSPTLSHQVSIASPRYGSRRWRPRYRPRGTAARYPARSGTGSTAHRPGNQAGISMRVLTSLVASMSNETPGPEHLPPGAVGSDAVIAASGLEGIVARHQRRT